jgi:hypothetical protein
VQLTAWQGEYLLFLGLASYALAQACRIAISIHYPQPASSAEHWESLTVLGAILNFGYEVSFCAFHLHRNCDDTVVACVRKQARTNTRED